jgi:eukaryotic-like serine/threonine-protein kinase
MTMTLPNVIKGKMSYTAPELTRGGKASGLSDLFSLGVTLWEALSGHRLFGGGSPLEVVRAIQAWQVPDLTVLRPDAPRPLIDAVVTAIAREPERRFPSAAHMAQALGEILASLPEPIDESRLAQSVTNAQKRLRDNLPPPLPPAPVTIPSISVEIILDSGVASAPDHAPGIPRPETDQVISDLLEIEMDETT